MHDVKEMTHQKDLNELLHIYINIMSQVNVFSLKVDQRLLILGDGQELDVVGPVISVAIDRHKKK